MLGPTARRQSLAASVAWASCNAAAARSASMIDGELPAQLDAHDNGVLVIVAAALVKPPTARSAVTVT